MNTQQAFDRICEHLMAQRRCSESVTGNCVYRGEDGTKCAIGCLIPDELYRSDMEGKVIRDLLSNNIQLAEQLCGVSLTLLSGCQRIHDFHEVHEWKTLLRETADIHGLAEPACIAATLL